MDSDDPFDEVLNLEEQYYKEGYEEGFKDGQEAGRIEGRSVGLKKGFEKFLEAGRLQGKAIIWANRLPNLRKRSAPIESSQEEAAQGLSSSSRESQSKEPEPQKLPPLNSNPRLEKNVTMLYGLVEPGTFSMENDDESVNDFDSRMKGAQSRLKMIERAIGEGGDKTSADKHRRPAQLQKNENIEDIGRIPQRREETKGKGKGSLPSAVASGDGIDEIDQVGSGSDNGDKILPEFQSLGLSNEENIIDV
ncbi:DUF1715-domain-containing protein [Hypoxylon sp. NC1633]|nr:DUF1715-domain-containing protein [Hypoxylon sp. NC1633]